MGTIIQAARRGVVTDEMKKIAEVEGVDVEKVRNGIAAAESFC